MIYHHALVDSCHPITFIINYDTVPPNPALPRIRSGHFDRTKSNGRNARLLEADDPPSLALSQVSRQIHAEAAPLFSGKNTFGFADVCQMRTFLKAHRLRLPLVRKLGLASCVGFCMGPQGILYSVLELLGPAVRLEELHLSYLVLKGCCTRVWTVRTVRLRNSRGMRQEWMEGLGREMGDGLAVLGVLRFSKIDRDGRVVDDATPNLRKEGLWSCSIKGQEEFREELAKLLTKGKG
jgi:hypothetical protein